MHNYTRLQLEELKDHYHKEREKEWASLSSDALSLGMYGSSCHILQFLEMGHKYVNKLIDGLFETEKVALFHEQPELSESYFVALNKEILEFVKSEYETIRTEALENFRSNNDIIIPNIQQYESSTCESINRRIKMLQEELRLGILQSSTETMIHVSGDVGVINTGVIYDSIKVKIEKLKESNQTELVNVLTRLIETVKNSTIKEEDKLEQMENVDFLVEQSVLPPGKRNRGLIKAAEGFLSTAANLATIWGQIGQAIMKFFGAS